MQMRCLTLGDSELPHIIDYRDTGNTVTAEWNPGRQGNEKVIEREKEGRRASLLSKQVVCFGSCKGGLCFGCNAWKYEWYCNFFRCHFSFH
jgi:D-hexose-6-phosphate mutarotase